MTKVIVTSLNPAKIAAVETAFRSVFPDNDMTFEGISVSSDVADQPMTSEETLAGARNRVHNAKKVIDGNFYVGVEAGLDNPFTFAWMVIESSDRTGESRSASVPLPPQALKALETGKELGDVMDEMFNEENVKQKGGAIGMLTGHLLTRSSVYHQALILALIPFMHPNLFPPLDKNNPSQNHG
ncbi:inosine/xanthosine triphosphatase [Enterovibrio norvegicus FF-454]|uniref:Inosine/xanthosine triphosphatase n=1 Tax=Enterovibrio norvegicus FF-454 TaxID=1185651 RepID=A0A1E5C3A1_9GAMM|nr:inosine/xanthosine triphosphatase [Enterovibrio norvegicus]OEE59945.1 inosine/xanthosine triphosphatase [Enterovibrio norvegicus FF-454]